MLSGKCCFKPGPRDGFSMSLENAKSLMPFKQMKQCGFGARWGMNSNPTNGRAFSLGPDSNKTHTFLLYNTLIF